MLHALVYNLSVLIPEKAKFFFVLKMLSGYLVSNYGVTYLPKEEVPAKKDIQKLTKN